MISVVKHWEKKRTNRTETGALFHLFQTLVAKLVPHRHRHDQQRSTQVSTTSGGGGGGSGVSE